VTPEDLDKRAKELGVMSIETSAKAGHNVKTLFKKIAMALPGGSAEVKDAAANQSEWGDSSGYEDAADPWCTEIDVSATPGEELPQASSCQC
jgi:Ras-related protein Rab-6A